MKYLFSTVLIIFILMFTMSCTKYTNTPDDALKLYWNENKILVNDYDILGKEQIENNIFLVLYRRDNFLVAQKFYNNKKDWSADRQIQGAMQLQYKEPLEYFITSGTVNNTKYTSVVGVVNSDTIKSIKVFENKDGYWNEIASTVSKAFMFVDFKHNAVYKIVGYNLEDQVVFENP